MKKIMVILVCMLICFSLVVGCADQKGGRNQDANLGNDLEIDVSDIEVDTETRPNAEDHSGNTALPDGFTYSFRDPDNADGIIVTPRE